jgi:outer membrane immunogenic protein
MRRLIVAAVPLALSTVIAAAADWPRPAKVPAYTPAPAPMRAFYDWTGFYVGGNLGGGWANVRTDFGAGGATFATGNDSLSGVLGGLQLGYNWQTGPAVFGLEADFQYSGVSGQLDAPTCPAAVCGVATTASIKHKLPWFGTVRGRVGYAQDTWMIYGTGGWAYARLDTDASATAGAVSATLSRSENRSGWVLGGGIEVAFSRSWTAKAEYLYMDYGRRSDTLTFTGIPPISMTSRISENVVRAGVNYRF